MLFDVATDNYTSKTSMSFQSDLYKGVTIKNAGLDRVGKLKVTQIDKAKYIYLDDKGCKVTIKTHNVLVCLGLPTHIISSQAGQNN
jgi:hypothetical protein